MVVLAVLSGFVVASVALCKFLYYPFPFIALLAAVLLGCFFYRTKKTAHRFILVNLMAIVFTLGSFEAYLDWKDYFWRRAHKLEYNASPRLSEELREYVPKKDFTYRVNKYIDGLKVWNDVAYSINEHGLRIGANTGNEASKAVVFLGGSYTFGDGLPDEATLPWQFEILAEGRYDAVNLGYSGYTAWQMERLIKSEKFESLLEGKKVSFAVYSAIPSHVGRDYHKNILEAPFLSKYFFLSMDKSLIFKNIYKPESNLRRIREYAQRVSRIKKHLQREYHAPLIVLFWDNRGRAPDQKPEAHASSIRKALGEHGVNVIAVEEKIFFQYQEPPQNYHIKNEGHPNALANRRIAEFLIERIPT